MKLRRITALCSLVVTAFLMGSTLLVSRRILLRNYETLEREDVTQRVAGTAAVVRAEVVDLDRTANDYASWDQTYAYMHHPTQQYVDSELSSDTLTTLGVSVLMLVAPNGKVALFQSYGRSKNVLGQDSSLLQAAVRMSSQAGTHNRAGLIQMKSGPAIIVLRSILPTGGKGASRGTLVAVRMIDDRMLLQWSAVTTVPFVVSGIPAPARALSFREPVPITSLPIMDDSTDGVLSVRSKLVDFWGQPHFTLSFRYSREIWRQGRATIHILALLLGSLGVIFGLVNLWLMDRFVVVRIHRLIRFTHDIRGTAGLTARTPVWGADEVSQLGTQMNHMLEELESSQQQLMATQAQLMFEATHDHLTGSFNRAAGVDFLERELSRARRAHRTVGVILIDIDHFKKINDRFGHGVGDRALKELAASITPNLRNFDLFARYGGEEFLIVAPNCSLAETAQLADRVLRRVRATAITIGNETLTLTASAGVSTGRAPLNPEEVIAHADSALYRAKANGRNRVEIESAPHDWDFVSNTAASRLLISRMD